MAVLPFRDPGASAGLGMALGMAEEISATLARFCDPHIIATATFWDGSGLAPDAMARCRDCQLDYVIDGVIGVSGDEIHVDVRLLDVVLDCEVIWRRRFEGKLNDLFSLQYQIAFDMVRQVDPELFPEGTATETRAKA